MITLIIIGTVVILSIISIIAHYIYLNVCFEKHIGFPEIIFTNESKTLFQFRVKYRGKYYYLNNLVNSNFYSNFEESFSDTKKCDISTHNYKIKDLIENFLFTYKPKYFANHYKFINVMTFNMFLMNKIEKDFKQMEED